MKTNLSPWFIAPALLALLATISAQLSIGFAQGTAFTYQGRLDNNGIPASGSYDVVFQLYTTNVTGAALARPVTNLVVHDGGGFWAGIFSRANYWLDISVRTNGSGEFVNLSPRQPLTPPALCGDGGKRERLARLDDSTKCQRCP